MTLFPAARAKTKVRAVPRDRADRVIPTGPPRLVESSSARSARASAEAWESLLGAVRRSCQARLTMLSGRHAGDRVACPWEPITRCQAGCRCGGAATVTVEFLRRHYGSLADDLAQLARPAGARRRS